MTTESYLSIRRATGQHIVRGFKISASKGSLQQHRRTLHYGRNSLRFEKLRRTVKYWRGDLDDGVRSLKSRASGCFYPPKSSLAEERLRYYVMPSRPVAPRSLVPQRRMPLVRACARAECSAEKCTMATRCASMKFC